MKKLFTLYAMLLLTVCLFAQAPQKMNYQAVVRNANNSLVANQNVSARISILQGSATGVAVYAETHNVQTNANGLMTLEVGGGNANSGSFAAIDWANGPYFIKSEIDPEGGIDYSVTTTQQLMSVPYALYAGNAIDMEERMTNLEKQLDSLKQSYYSNNPLPGVTTDKVTGILQNSAICGGNVYCEGYGSVKECGVCWSTSQNPTVEDKKTSDGRGKIPFASFMTGLAPNTTYYVRAYAANEFGIGYGSQQQFTTAVGRPGDDGAPCQGASTVTDYDGNSYKTVKLGEQCWMAENLRTTKYADGTNILQGSTTSDDVAYWYYPQNDSSSKATYGLLYNWPAVMRNATSNESNPSDVQGICPTGWHVPSDAEWTQLTDYLGNKSMYQCNGNSSNIAKSLASIIGWRSSTINCSVGKQLLDNNVTGFSAFPAGNYTGSYDNFGDAIFFWTSTQSGNGYAFGRNMYYAGVSVYRSYRNMFLGYSVRCLKD